MILWPHGMDVDKLGNSRRRMGEGVTVDAAGNVYAGEVGADTP